MELEDTVILNNKDTWLIKEMIKFMEWGIKYDYGMPDENVDVGIYEHQMKILRLKVDRVEELFRRQSELDGKGQD